MESIEFTPAERAGVIVGRARGRIARCALLLAGLCALQAAAAPGDTNLVTAIPATHRAAGGFLDSVHGASRDGRYVVFSSQSPVFGATDDDDGAFDVFVKDRWTGDYQQVNVSASGVPGNHTSWRPSIGARGRYVVFESNSTDLAPGNPDALWAIYLRDLELGTTELVSVDGGSGTTARDGSFPAVTADGRFVVFASWATDLVQGETWTQGGLYLRDRDQHSTQRIADCAGQVAISADGRFVAYTCAQEVHLYDRSSGRRETSSTGAGFPVHPFVSADGRFVAWADAAPLAPGDTNATYDVALLDRGSGLLEWISRATGGASSDGLALWPSVSDDGRYVAYYSNASDATTDGFGAGIFVRDRIGQTTERASVDNQGGPTRVVGLLATLTGDGRFVFFDTDTPLVPNDRARGGDAGDEYDVYVHWRGEVRTPVFEFALNPATLEFGDRALGTRSSLSFWLRNTGRSTLPVRESWLAGADREAFSRSRQCDYIFPGASCRIRITLNATTLGPQSAGLHVVAGADTEIVRAVHANVLGGVASP